MYKLQNAMRNELDSVYIIGETAYNHEGDFQYLKDMVDSLAEVGASAVKFHMLIELDSYITKSHQVYDIIKNWVFSKEQWIELIDYSHSKGLEVIALTDDIESINIIIGESIQVAGIELHSTCINDYHMLKSLADYKGVVLLGVGGTGIDEITYAVETLNSYGINDIVLMYGFQKYPTDYKKINLNKMEKLGRFFELPVGYADHTRFDDPYNIQVTSLGVAKGARIIEKHFTLDEGKERIDYQAAIGMNKFVELMNALNIVYKTLGSGSVDMTEDEKQYGAIGLMKKAMVASRDINAGEVISYDDITYKRSGESSLLAQTFIHKLNGKRTKEKILKDTVIKLNQLED